MTNQWQINNSRAVGADASRSSPNAPVFSNAKVTYGRNAVFAAGQDITLAVTPDTG